jgi:hypothetical protein
VKNVGIRMNEDGGNISPEAGNMDGDGEHFR